VSSPAVLLLNRGVIHSGFCGSARKLLRGRKDTFDPAISASRGRDRYDIYNYRDDDNDDDDDDDDDERNSGNCNEMFRVVCEL